MQIIKTNNNMTTVSSASLEKGASALERSVINLYPDVTFQTFLGFGGAFTEASGYVLSKMPKNVREEIIESYYGKSGIGYSFGRTHMDSCDFALGNYSACENETLEPFDITRDNDYILPIIKLANEKAGTDVKLLMAPWSPPPFMKSNGEKNRGGTLLPQYRPLWAEYICKYIETYRQHGIAVFAFTIQNEPMATQTWDSCIYTAESERDFLRDYMIPALKKHGLDTKIMVWDHNKESLFNRSRTVFDDQFVRDHVWGSAFHWYSGDHFEALDIMRKIYPEKALVFTEGCVEYSKFSADSQLTNAQMYAHDIIGNLNAGMNASVDWNLVLNSSGGPNHVGNLCDAPIMCDIAAQSYEKKLSYTYIGHFSKYIRPGATRIGYTKFTDCLEITAFKNIDGTIAAVVLNRTGNNISYNVKINGCVCNLTAEKNSIATLLLEEIND